MGSNQINILTDISGSDIISAASSDNGYITTTSDGLAYGTTTAYSRPHEDFKHEQPLFLVYYFGCEKIDKDEVHRFLHQFSEFSNDALSKNERWVVVQDPTSAISYVELLNPTKLDKAAYETAMAKFDKLEARVNALVIADPLQNIEIYKHGDKKENKTQEEG